MRHLHILNRFIMVILGVSIFSCVVPFEYESDLEKKLLVVDGGITQQNDIHELKLSFSSAYGSQAQIPIDFAEVILFDDSGKSDYYYHSENGRYILQGNSIQIRPGKAYFIEIRLNDQKVYRSYPQVMPDPLTPDSLYFKIETKQELNEHGIAIETNYLNLYLNTPLYSDKRTNLIWRSDHVYSLTEVKWHPLVDPKVCYVKKIVESDQAYIFTSSNYEKQKIYDTFVSQVVIYPDWQFFEKHFYNIHQYSITDEAYDYWEKVNEISFPTGSIFDTPPAPIEGNVYNIYDPEEVVLGFFEVSSRETIRIWTNKHHLKPLAITDRCNDEYLYRSWSDEACRDCLVLDNATAERPLYWGE